MPPRGGIRGAKSHDIHNMDVLIKQFLLCWRISVIDTSQFQQLQLVFLSRSISPFPSLPRSPDDAQLTCSLCSVADNSDDRRSLHGNAPSSPPIVAAALQCNAMRCDACLVSPSPGRCIAPVGRSAALHPPLSCPVRSLARSHRCVRSCASLQSESLHLSRPPVQQPAPPSLPPPIRHVRPSGRPGPGAADDGHGFRSSTEHTCTHKACK